MTSTLLSRIWLISLGMLISGAVVAADDRFDLNVDIPHEVFKLDNGLTLIVHEDRKAPIVAVNIWYHVGSKNEVRGKTGFAHLFEHLMFNGSENFDDDYFQATERLGATTINGTTSRDRTNYFQNVPKNALDSILWLESDRMGNLLGAITQEKLDEQREVVKNEKRQRENSPYGRAAEIQYPSIYPYQHPYSWTTIGSMDDLEAATVEDVHEWFKQYYGANNTVLVIAGDVETAAVVERVKHYFGEIQPGPPLTKHQQWPNKLTGTQKQISYDRVSETMMMKSWNIGGNNELETTYLDLAAAIMSSGKSSRLYKRLVYDEQLVSSVSAYTSAGEIAGTFEISAMINPGVSEEKIDAIITEELNKFLDKGPTRKELERVKIQTISGFVRGMESIGGFGGKSDILASNYIYTGDPAHYKIDLDTIKNATRDQLRETAVKWLSDGLYQLEIRPFPELAAKESEVDRSGLPTLGPAPEIAFEKYQRATLSNGLNVIVANRSAVPVVRMMLSIDAGYAADQFATPGVARLAMNMLDEGTKKRDALDIGEELTLLGASVGAGSSLDNSVVNFSALTTTLEDSLDIFADVVLNPAFPEKELARLKIQQLNSIRREQFSPQSMALRIFPRLVYGDGHAYSNPFSGAGTVESVTGIEVADLQKFHDTWFKPNNATIFVVGDITIEEVMPLLEAKFSIWKESDVPTKNISSVKRSDKPTIYLIDRPEAVQSVILGGHVTTPKANDFEMATSLMNTVLGGASTSRVNMNLREDKGWSYGAGTGIVNAKGPRFFYAIANVQSDKTAASLQELMKEINGFLTHAPITEEELAKAKKNSTLSLPGQWETGGAVLGSLAQMVQYDLADDYFDTYASNIRAVSKQEAEAAAKKVIFPNSLVWVVVGDKEKVQANLDALGYGKAILIDSEGNRL
ncbi:MAG: zinc protease [Sulfitobacter sp.]|jgi:zinc protease